MQGVFGELEPATISISGLLEHIGKHAKSGILHTAARNKIPVYNPAVQDSMIGLQYRLFSQTNKVTVDAFADMPALMDRCFTAKKAGAMLVGGGVPKNFILQSMLMTPNGFSYAIQLTGRPPGPRRALGCNAGRGPVMGQDHGRCAGRYGVRRRHDHAARCWQRQ